MKRTGALPFLCTLLAATFFQSPGTAPAADVSATLDIDVAKPGTAIPKTFYGLMTEEINHAYDGGLFAELIQNRTFQDPQPRNRQSSSNALPIHWSLTGNGKAALDKTDPVNPALPVSLRRDAGAERRRQ